MILNQERLKEVLVYDSEREMFFYKEDGKRHVKGQIAGRIGRYERNNNAKICVDGEYYTSYQLIWLWHYGEFPKRRLQKKDRSLSVSQISNFVESTAGPINKVESIRRFFEGVTI